MGFIGDGISYALRYYPYEHQKVSLGLFLIVMAAALLLTQMTFTHVLKERLNSAREWLVFIGVTALCYVNVLIAEMFYFTESYLIFKMSMLFAMLGCYLYSRRHYATGTIALLIAPTFYQMSCVQAALVMCTLAVLEERGEFSTRLIRKELAYIGVPMCAGLLNYVTGPIIASYMSGIVHEPLYSAKQISAGGSTHNTWMIAEFHDLYQSSLRLMMPVYLPLLFSLIITAVVLYCIYRQSNVLVTYLIYKVTALLLAVGMQVISGTHAFIPRMMYVFYVMQSMNAIIALYYVDRRVLRHSIQYIGLGYVLAQVFFIQIIIENRCLGEYLDRSYANQILDYIEAYEEENDVEIRTLSFRKDERSLPAFPEVYYYKGAINTRLLGDTAYTLVETIARERGRSFEQIDMESEIYEEYFAGNDWQEINLDEQVVIIGDTFYMCVF